MWNKTNFASGMRWPGHRVCSFVRSQTNCYSQFPYHTMSHSSAPWSFPKNSHKTIRLVFILRFMSHVLALFIGLVFVFIQLLNTIKFSLSYLLKGFSWVLFLSSLFQSLCVSLCVCSVFRSEIVLFIQFVIGFEKWPSLYNEMNMNFNNFFSLLSRAFMLVLVCVSLSLCRTTHRSDEINGCVWHHSNISCFRVVEKFLMGFVLELSVSFTL